MRARSGFAHLTPVRRCDGRRGGDRPVQGLRTREAAMQWTLGALALLTILPVAGVLWMTAVPGRSHAGPLPPLMPDKVQLATRLEEHVRAVASRPHNVSHPQELEQAARYIEGALAGMGYGVHRQAF